jgi:hypothetical protein
VSGYKAEGTATGKVEVFAGVNTYIATPKGNVFRFF